MDNVFSDNCTSSFKDNLIKVIREGGSISVASECTSWAPGDKGAVEIDALAFYLEDGSVSHETINLVAHPALRFEFEQVERKQKSEKKKQGGALASIASARSRRGFSVLGEEP